MEKKPIARSHNTDVYYSSKMLYINKLTKIFIYIYIYLTFESGKDGHRIQRVKAVLISEE